MKKSIVLIPLLFILVSLTLTNVLAETSSVSGKIIIIDPGHGGSDPGTTQCPGYYESTANLDIAEELKAKLTGAGAIVHMTREGDVYKTNEDRYTFANANSGDVLVSIHLNGSLDHLRNGTKGLYGKQTKDKVFTQVMHKRLPLELGVYDEGITNFASGVLLKSNMPATLQESVYLSNEKECVDLRDGGGFRQKEIAQSLFNGLEDWFSSQSTVKPPRGKK